MGIRIEDLLCHEERENHLVPTGGAVFRWHFGGDGGDAAVGPLTVAIIQGGRPVWTKTCSGDTVRVKYDGPALAPGARYTFSVSAQAGEHTVGASAVFDTAPASVQEVFSGWIWLDPAYTPPTVVNEHYTGYASPEMRRHFSVDGRVERALLYTSALGVYELALNGERLHDTWFDPGWTDYRTRIAYQAYDVAALLRQGDNTLDVCLGDGWYRGFLIFHDRNYGDIPLKWCGNLMIEYADGRVQHVRSDKGWTGGTGSIAYADFQMGERCAPLPDRGQDSYFRLPVCCAPERELTARLVPQLGPPIREKTRFVPQLMHRHGDELILNVGQNIAGVVQLTLRGVPAGRAVRLTYGEMLCEDGSLYTENLRIARQQDLYVTLGLPEETYRPHFTSHGFQYVAIAGLTDEEYARAAVEAIALTADCRDAGAFSCGEPLVDRLYQNLRWGQWGNFSSVPTDCPQRNERLGWTGDAQVFCATACYDQDCYTYYLKYCRDMEDALTPDGAVPDVVPLLYGKDGRVFFERGNAAWADAGIVIPWRLYTFYGDADGLRACYPLMQRYAAYLTAHSPDDIYRRADYSDWLSVGEVTCPEVLATAYAAYDMALMEKTAAVLGKTEEAQRYRAEADRFCRGFYRHFVREDGVIRGDTQTAYVLALYFGIARREDEPRFAARLAKRIADNGGHLSCGFVGISYLLPVLCEHGYTELAYDLLLNTTYPSWLYSVINGATTIWERWDSYTVEHGFGDTAMNSFNHYSLGSVGEWMYSHCAGIRPAGEDGSFSRVRICPYPDERLRYCRAAYRTPRGEFESGWAFEGGRIRFTVSVPPMTEAVLELPAVRRDGRLVYSREERTAVPVRAGRHTFFAEEATKAERPSGGIRLPAR